MDGLFKDLEAACGGTAPGTASGALDQQADVDARGCGHGIGGGSSFTPGGSRQHAVLAASPSEHCMWEFCDDCGVATEGSPRSLSEMICPECGRLFERPFDEDQAGEDGSAKNPGIRQAPRLRMVGENHSKLQRELDKSAQIDPEASKISELYRELTNYHNEYVRKTGKAFSPDAGTILRDVAVIYVREVASRADVMRAQNKRAVLAKLLDVYCKQTNRASRRDECVALMQLPNGLARGESQLRAIGACGDMLNCDQDKAWVETSWTNLGIVYRPFELQEEVFHMLGSEPPAGEEHDEMIHTKFTYREGDKQLIQKLRDASYEIIQAGKKKHIGIEFIPQTRGVAATYAVLRRAALAGILPPHWKIPVVIEGPPGSRGTIDWIAGACKIRAQTLRGYLNKLFKFHSKFVGVYTKHGLLADRIENI